MDVLRAEPKLLNEDYNLVIKEIASFSYPILSYLPRSVVDYTDHGLIHSYNLVNILNSLFESGEFQFSEGEKYLLYLAAFMHDWGCLYGREKHNENSVRILEYLSPEIENTIGKGAFNYLKPIIYSHSRAFALKKIGDTPVDLFAPKDVRLKLLCAVFRLVDACDGSDRVKPILYRLLTDDTIVDSIRSSCPKFKKLNPTSRNIWAAHLDVISVELSLSEKAVRVVIKTSKEKNIVSEDLLKEFKTVKSVFKKYGFPVKEVVIIELPEEW